MLKFHLILPAAQRNISGTMFWQLLIGTVVMLAAGYCAEAHFVNAWLGFAVGMAGWFLILFENLACVLMDQPVRVAIIIPVVH